MAWSDIALQFSLELAFGVLFALAFVPKAPVGLFFYRLMGTVAVVLVLAGVGMELSAGTRAWSDPVLLASALALLAYPVYSGPVRGRKWAAGLGLALLGLAFAVGRIVSETAPAASAGEISLASASALATGAVAGGVGLAMVLGHRYLTVPNLAVSHLRRLNRVCFYSMLASAALLVLSCFVFREVLSSDERSLFDATGLFYLGTRVAVGLIFPLAFAGMAASSLRFENTRSATGILYGSTILVLIGTAVSLSLQDSYGIPL